MPSLVLPEGTRLPSSPDSCHSCHMQGKGMTACICPPTDRPTAAHLVDHSKAAPKVETICLAVLDACGPLRQREVQDPGLVLVCSNLYPLLSRCLRAMHGLEFLAGLCSRARDVHLLGRCCSSSPGRTCLGRHAKCRSAGCSGCNGWGWMFKL